MVTATDKTQNLLKTFFVTPDPIALQSIFGENLKSDRFLKDWQDNRHPFPEIEIVNRSQINNANGAFARDTNKIYLAQEFLLANRDNSDVITNVLLEEYGHYLDSQLNITDAPGDEGAIFAALVRGEGLSDSELQQLRDEDDSAVVVLEGVEVAIENSAVSSNARYVAYVKNNRLFIKDRVSGNVNNTGFNVDGLGINETDLDVSADGKYVIFTSSEKYSSTRLGNVNSYIGYPSYVYETQAGQIEHVNVISYPSLSEIAPGFEDYFDSSEQAFKDNFAGEASSAEDVSISADGRYLAYSETNSFNPDYTDSIVVLDRVTKQHLLISDGSDPTINGDGRYVAYEKKPGIYVYDRTNQSSTKIANVGSEPKISLNGNYVVYEDIGNLYLYNRAVNQTQLIYSNSNSSVTDYSITDDGRVAYYDAHTKEIVIRNYVGDSIKKIDSDILSNDYPSEAGKIYGGLTINGDGTTLFYKDKVIDLKKDENEYSRTEVGFFTSQINVFEDDGSAAIDLVRLSGNTDLDVDLTVKIDFSGTAINGEDYSFPNTQTITIPAGQSSTSLNIPLINDLTFEDNETINLELINVNGFSKIGEQNTTSITIQNDDEPISFDAIAEFLSKDTAYKNWNQYEGDRSYTIGSVYEENINDGFYGEIFGAEPSSISDLEYYVDEVFEGGSGFYSVGLKSLTGHAPILVLRGTEPNDILGDVFSDAHSKGVGFNQFEAHKDELTDWLSKVSRETEQNPNIVGHSLGGALAQWIAAEYTGKNNKNLGQVVTFNSPAINEEVIELRTNTNSLFPFPKRELAYGANVFNSELAESVTHYVTSGDIVSLAGEDYISGDYKIYDLEGEDLSPVKNILEAHLSPVLLKKKTNTNFNLEDSENISFKKNGKSNFISSESFNYLDDADYTHILDWLVLQAENISTEATADQKAYEDFLRLPNGLRTSFHVKNAVSSLAGAIAYLASYRGTVEPSRELIGEILKVDEVSIARDNSKNFGEKATEIISSRIEKSFTIWETNQIGFDNIQTSSNVEVSSIVQQAIDESEQYLSSFALDNNYSNVLDLAFGNNWNIEKAQLILQNWSKNRFDDVPTIQILDETEMGDINGAYEISTGNIYLSQDFIQQNITNVNNITSVILEEIGHHVDSIINEADTPGDEGEIFSALVRGKELSNSEILALINENDRTTVIEDTVVWDSLNAWSDNAWQTTSLWTDEQWEEVGQWTDEQWLETTQWTDEQWLETAPLSTDRLSLNEVHRFYQYEKGFHLYTTQEKEINFVKENSEAGELSYNYESEQYRVLTDNTDTLTGDEIEGVKPIYRFFNTGTGAHLYTMNEKEKNYIQENLSNYNFEGIKYYAFENAPQELETIPVYRMLNNQSGAHLYSSSQKEIDYIQENLPYFSMENDGNAAFHVFDL